MKRRKKTRDETRTKKKRPEKEETGKAKTESGKVSSSGEARRNEKHSRRTRKGETKYRVPTGAVPAGTHSWACTDTHLPRWARMRGIEAVLVRGSTGHHTSITHTLQSIQSDSLDDDTQRASSGILLYCAVSHRRVCTNNTAWLTPRRDSSHGWAILYSAFRLYRRVFSCICSAFTTVIFVGVDC